MVHHLRECPTLGCGRFNPYLKREIDKRLLFLDVLSLETKDTRSRGRYKKLSETRVASVPLGNQHPGAAENLDCVLSSL